MGLFGGFSPKPTVLIGTACVTQDFLHAIIKQFHPAEEMVAQDEEDSYQGQETQVEVEF